MNEIKKYQIVPAAETVFVIPAEPVLSRVEGAGIQLFRSEPLLLQDMCLARQLNQQFPDLARASSP